MTAIHPAQDQVQAFLARPGNAPVAMLNLLKFKDKATYEADSPEAGENLSGQEAYARYGAAVTPILADLGAKTLFAGPVHGLLIGEGDWDMAAIVEYPNRTVMIGMGTSQAYQAIHYHRAAGLAHQLLIDTTKLALPA